MRIRRLIRNWPTYIVRNRLGRAPLVTYELRNGIRYAARRNSGDIASILDIWSKRIYSPAGFDIHVGDNVIDIGAHSGVFAIYAAEKAVRGTVYAFEPIQDNYELMEKNIALNNKGNVVPLRMAVAGSTGSQEIFLSSNDLAHSLHETLLRESVVGSHKVETISLEEVLQRFCPNGVDMLKMNCEGAEYEILLNCPVELLRGIGRMAIQYHNIDDKLNVRVLKELLQSNGFSVEIRPPGEYSILYARMESRNPTTSNTFR
jgi:FkbM family methyltransferase